MFSLVPFVLNPAFERIGHAVGDWPKLIADIERSRRTFEVDFEIRRLSLRSRTAEAGRNPEQALERKGVPPELRAAYLVSISAAAYRRIMEGAEAKRIEAERLWFERLGEQHRRGAERRK
ncbi:hypothetical protein D3C87_1810350 [compost metagenome]